MGFRKHGTVAKGTQNSIHTLGIINRFFQVQVWQCGGSMNIIPCSRVGHLFRTSTYSFGDGDVDEIKTKNNKRLVDVWMNDSKHLYYAANPCKLSFHKSKSNFRFKRFML